jgi:hypothetical protein
MGVDMVLEKLLYWVSGPFGALALAVAILYWLATKVVPVLQKYLENQNDRLHEMVRALEKTVDAHELDRRMFEASIAGLSSRIDRVETDITHIRSKLV